MVIARRSTSASSSDLSDRFETTIAAPYEHVVLAGAAAARSRSAIIAGHQDCHAARGTIATTSDRMGGPPDKNRQIVSP